MALKVREATAVDFDDIYKLLKRLNDTSLSRSDWQRITKVDFDTKENHYGYVLESDTELLGFLGTIFSQRQVGGQELNFCNIHSWIVDPKAKTGGMALLLKVLRLKTHIITNFTASEGPYKIFKSLKFKEVEYKNYKLLPLQSNKAMAKVTVQNVTDDNAEKLLDQQEQKLYKAHRHFDNVQFLCVSNQESRSFVITKRKVYVPGAINKIPILKSYLRRKMFLAEIHYISNPDVFIAGFSNTRTAIHICKALGSLGIIMANRYLPVAHTLTKKLYPSKRPYFYRHADNDHLIDTLYSELFVLNF